MQYLGSDDAGVSSFSLQDFEPSFGSKLNAAVRESWLESYGPVAADWAGAKMGSDGSKRLSAAEAMDYAKTEGGGVKLKLSPKDGEYTASQWSTIVSRQRELAAVKDVRERTPWDMGSVIRGGAMFGAGIVDPINLATAFVPWTKAIGAANGLRAAAMAESALTRAGARATLGAADAGISTLALEPFYYGMRQELGDDYGALDSMANIAFGTAFGGGLHAGGGAIADAWKGYRGTASPMVTPNPAMDTAAPLTGSVPGMDTKVRVGDAYEPARWSVVEADTLQATVDKADNQFRDRSRPAYQAEIQSRANSLDPALVLADSPVMDIGAPTLAADGRIVGGNGRTLFISKAYEIGKGGDYRAALEARLAELGIDTDAVRGMQKPVLVRQFTRDVDVKRAAMLSNEGGATDMSPLEQAKVDAERLGDTRLSVSADGDINNADNRAAIRKWVEAQPENKRNSIMDSDGKLSPEGLRRLNGAMLFKAYGDTPTLARLIEAVDPGSRNLALALGRTAPVIAGMRQSIDAGNLHPLDIAADLQQAIEKYNQIREQGMKVPDYLAQLDAFGDGLTPEATMLLDFMGRNIQSPRRIMDAITGFADRLTEAGNPKQEDMFGAVATPDKARMLQDAITAAESSLDTASEVVAGLAPETREATLRAAVAQSVDGRMVDVDPIIGMDESLGTHTIEDVAAATDRNFEPENMALADMDASADVQARVDAAPKWAAVKDAEAALSEADALLADTMKAGDNAFKYSRGEAPGQKKATIWQGTTARFAAEDGKPHGGFRWDMINSVGGEQAQAFGYGHYVAQQAWISQTRYRERLIAGKKGTERDMYIPDGTGGVMKVATDLNPAWVLPDGTIIHQDQKDLAMVRKAIAITEITNRGYAREKAALEARLNSARDALERERESVAEWKAKLPEGDAQLAMIMRGLEFDEKAFSNQELDLAALDEVTVEGRSPGAAAVMRRMLEELAAKSDTSSQVYKDVMAGLAAEKTTRILDPGIKKYEPPVADNFRTRVTAGGQEVSGVLADYISKELESLKSAEVAQTVGRELLSTVAQIKGANNSVSVDALLSALDLSGGKTADQFLADAGLRAEVDGVNIHVVDATSGQRVYVDSSIMRAGDRLATASEAVALNSARSVVEGKTKTRAKDFDAVVSELQSLKSKGVTEVTIERPGSLYRAEMSAEDFAGLMLWDEKLSAQPEKVRAAFKGWGIDAYKPEWSAGADGITLSHGGHTSVIKEAKLPSVEQMADELRWKVGEAPAGSPAPWSTTYRDGSVAYWATKADAESVISREWKMDKGLDDGLFQVFMDGRDRGGYADMEGAKHFAEQYMGAKEKTAQSAYEDLQILIEDVQSDRTRDWGAIENDASESIKVIAARRGMDPLETHWRTFKPDEIASVMLHNAGVPGHAFLDGASRGDKELPAYNLVLYSDDVAKIMDRYARQTGEVLRGTDDPAGLTEALRLQFGSSTERLLSEGRVQIVATPSDIPGGPHPGDVKGATAPDGTVYIVASNVSEVEARGMLLHEVGVHVGMERMLGTEVFQSVLGELDDAIGRGEAWAQAARSSVPENTPAGLVREEQLAYLVQNSPELPIVRRIIAAVRAWAYQNFELARDRMTLSEADFVALAVSALHHAAKGQDVGVLAGAYARLTGNFSFTKSEMSRGLEALRVALSKSGDFFGPDDAMGVVADFDKFWGPGTVTGGAMERVKLSLLVPTQDVIDPTAVGDILRTGVNGADSMIEAVRLNGVLYLQDGHHRVSALALAGKEFADVLIGDAASIDKNNQPVFGATRYSRGETPDPSTTKDELKSYDDAVKRAKGYASVLRSAADKLDNDAQATAAMRSAMPDITPQEINDLLGQLRTQVKGLRGMARTARSAVTSENTAALLQTDAMKAADELANNLELAAVIEKRNAALNINVRLKAAGYINQFRDAKLDFEGFRGLLVGTERKRAGGRISVDAEQKNFRGEWLGGMIADLEKGGLMRSFASGQFDREVYVALYNLGRDGAGNEKLPKEAVAIAEVVNKYQTDARNTRNRFGAWIRDLQGYITRQSHDMFKIREAGEQKYKAEVLPMLDVNRSMRDFEGSVDDFLTRVYDDFAAGSHMKTPTGEDDLAAFGAGSSLARKVSASRVLYFKDGDAAFQYNQKFGQGNLAESVLGGIDNAAKSAGLLKLLGTNPQATVDRLFAEYAESLRSDPKRRAAFLSHRKELENLLATVDGTSNIPGNVTAAQISSFFRSWQTMSKLGGMLISSITDLSNYAAEMRFGQDKNLLTGTLEGMGALTRGRSSGEKRAVLNSLGVFHESTLGSVFARFDSPELLGGKTSWAMQQFFKLTGINWWTESLRDGYALAHASYVSEQAGKAFDKLPGSLRDMLGLYNIDAGKWDVLRLANTQQADGRMYITPEGLRTVPRAALANYITQVGRTPNEAAIANLQDDLASALRTMTIDRMHHAVIEPGARTRAFMQRGTQPGTVSGELLRFVGQFKSFPVALIQSTLGREVYGRGYDTLGDYVKRGKGDMLGLASFIALSTAMGYAAMSVKDLIRGKNPRPVDDPRTWAAAMVQGGGLGLYGDFLFGKYNRMGGSLTGSMAGPVANLGDTAADLWTRIRTGEDFGAVALNAALANTPFANLFYTRIALDYLILFKIQEAMNPGFLRRMEKRVERENGQTFYMPPSQVAR